MGVGCLGRVPIMYIAHKPVLWTCYVANMLLVIVGLTGNILSFLILGYDKSRRNQSSAFYLRALAVADCMSLVCNTLLSSQQMMLRPAMELSPLNPVSLLVNSFPACNIRMFISYSSIMISVYIIVLFSIERALVLLNPFRWSRRLTLRKARIAVATLVVSSCLLSAPALFSFNRRVVDYPSRLYRNDTGETVYSDKLLSGANCDNGSRNSAGDQSVGGSVADIAFADENGTLPTRSHYGYVYAGESQEDSGQNSGLLSEFTAPNQLRSNVSRRLGGSPVNISSLLSRVSDNLVDSEVSGLPPGVLLSCKPVAECQMNFDVFKPFAVFHIVSLSIVPFIVTGVCNLIILAVLRRRGDQGDGRQLRKASVAPQAAEEVDRQVTKRLILVSTTYIVLSFPLALFHIVTDAMTGTYCFTWAANTLTITLTLNSVNFAVNFLLYCISEGQFRRLLATLLHCRQRNFARLLSYVTRPGHHRHRQHPGGRPAGATGNQAPGTATATTANRGQQTAVGTPAGVLLVTTTTGVGSNKERQLHKDPAEMQGEEDIPQYQSLLSATVCNTDSSSATTDALVHQEAAAVDNDNCCEEQYFRDCSLIKEDDWSSGQFSESGGGGGTVGGSFKKYENSKADAVAVTAKWSDVLPESPTEV